ncbi:MULTISPECIES: SGNH/GDSL hydrolase family protein [Paenibacillus]|uniref:SGNH/GDSL hydrolase family protein n=1 Tax=Paenibacillus TaxID=44249 RepID=UPI00096F120E|nr:SGNH/GDSL hydrolase family protein [Paenibacillus odorifer]MEC0130730.1 SGNH/GDSL hydrolase family protein [Paenibacillus odorifer]MEC0220936.1 SGNH/GDSL hydrolase family protein [Paenibacillus odorifer]OMD08866.1 GDSL family lipase [Paenibacillus odorifer]OMD13633.1 GDSL family lipase [Paenibacillus odorifer]OMD24672.1 GDSL family lipase [Paenibacillus odorifer]
MIFQQNDVILFQGDSITDWGRNHEDASSLGVGYAMMVAARLGYLYPEKNLTFINRGIGGNRIVDLQGRWDKDCLDLKPTWVSIYIGINDTWRRFDSGEETTPEQFEASYRDLIKRTQKSLDAKLVLIEPFVLPVPEDRRTWRQDLDPKIHIVRELAREYGAPLVPLDGLFAAASVKAEPAYWAYDGVHPTPAGHALIADAWLKTMGAI